MGSRLASWCPSGSNSNDDLCQNSGDQISPRTSRGSNLAQEEEERPDGAHDASVQIQEGGTRESIRKYRVPGEEVEIKIKRQARARETPEKKVEGWPKRKKSDLLIYQVVREQTRNL